MNMMATTMEEEVAENQRKKVVAAARVIQVPQTVEGVDKVGGGGGATIGETKCAMSSLSITNPLVF